MNSVEVKAWYTNLRELWITLVSHFKDMEGQATYDFACCIHKQLVVICELVDKDWMKTVGNLVDPATNEGTLVRALSNITSMMNFLEPYFAKAK